MTVVDNDSSGGEAAMEAAANSTTAEVQQGEDDNTATTDRHTSPEAAEDLTPRSKTLIQESIDAAATTQVPEEREQHNVEELPSGGGPEEESDESKKPPSSPTGDVDDDSPPPPQAPPSVMMTTKDAVLTFEGDDDGSTMMQGLTAKEEEEKHDDDNPDAAVPDEPKKEIEESPTADSDDDDDDDLPQPPPVTKDLLKSEDDEVDDDHHLAKQSDQEEKAVGKTSISETWTSLIHSFLVPIVSALLVVTRHAATHPKAYVIATIVFSLGICGIGFATNYYLEASLVIWTPNDTRTAQHGRWIEDTSNGFPVSRRYEMIIVHANGQNILQQPHEGVARLFSVLDVFRAHPYYSQFCGNATSTNNFNEDGSYNFDAPCEILGITNFWNDSTAIFNHNTASDDDAQVIETLSSGKFPNGLTVDYDNYIGYNECVDNSSSKKVNCTEAESTLTAGLSYVSLIGFPAEGEYEDAVMEFEADLIETLIEMKDEWANDDHNMFRLEFLMRRSFDDETVAAVSRDIPLLPLVFVIMSILCILLYAKKDPVQSRSWLGFGAVATVLLAIIGSFGLLFTIGVPFTNLTPILPFICFGIGLDDAFIITGAYARTDPNKRPEDRIEDTIRDCGATILLTTLTSSVAFALGLVSSIPAVQMLVLYAFPTIMIDFIYQVTFFVALIVLDERRIQDNRRDCCFCCHAKDRDGSNKQLQGNEQLQERTKPFADRIMLAYADVLLRPTVKGIVLVLFAALTAGMAYSVSHLEQYFDFTEIIPKDSYIQGFWDSFSNLYEENGVIASVYFRDVDFSKQSTRDQMYDYVQELVDMPFAGYYPTFDFWLLAFDYFVAQENLNVTEDNFNEHIATFLSTDPYPYFKKDIVIDESTGDMLSSRTTVRYNNHDYQDIHATIDALELQEEISAEQPINIGKKEWAFFTHAGDYNIWEFYRISPFELTLSTVLGTVSVSVLALLFIPHWSSVFVVFFMVALLYIDLLGFVQLCGVSVSPVMYVGMVMSVGLMVDYILHVLYRFLEVRASSREAKTKITLETIGASVMVGGFTTLVGVLPLGFSSSDIFFTIFVIFFGLVVLGLLHGLVLMPVLLSMIGPMVVLERDLGKEGDKSTRGDTPDADNGVPLKQEEMPLHDLTAPSAPSSQSSGQSSYRGDF